jgi:hypothetical protein
VLDEITVSDYPDSILTHSTQVTNNLAEQTWTGLWSSRWLRRMTEKRNPNC